MPCARSRSAASVFTEAKLGPNLDFVKKIRLATRLREPGFVDGFSVFCLETYADTSRRHTLPPSGHVSIRPVSAKLDAELDTSIRRNWLSTHPTPCRAKIICNETIRRNEISIAASGSVSAAASLVRRLRMLVCPPPG